MRKICFQKKDKSEKTWRKKLKENHAPTKSPPKNHIVFGCALLTPSLYLGRGPQSPRLLD